MRLLAKLVLMLASIALSVMLLGIVMARVGLGALGNLILAREMDVVRAMLALGEPSHGDAR